MHTCRGDIARDDRYLAAIALELLSQRRLQSSSDSARLSVCQPLPYLNTHAQHV